MQELEIQATYENGILKLDRELPLGNGQRVKLTVQMPTGRAKASAGIFHWQGCQEDLDYLILSEDNDPMDAP